MHDLAPISLQCVCLCRHADATAEEEEEEDRRRAGMGVDRRRTGAQEDETRGGGAGISRRTGGDDSRGADRRHSGALIKELVRRGAHRLPHTRGRPFVHHVAGTISSRKITELATGPTHFGRGYPSCL